MLRLFIYSIAQVRLVLEILLFAIDEGLKAIPFGGNPFYASGIENEEVIAVVGSSHLY